ncbi:restriction endonuclease subunit S [Candidatus Poriferisocius sp.]|uniref:restriction endonuclease subunit S n=1 Tax=Candidatus Poriferisocius sp. TaxID=3101276 RepID=UPI003B028C44
MTDKNISHTDWFYYAGIVNDGYTDIRFDTSPEKIDDLQNLLFFYSNNSEPVQIQDELKRLISVVETRDLDNVFAALTNSLWHAPEDTECTLLRHVAVLENGKSITENDASPGSIPVIAGGKSSPYTHSEYTHKGNVFTVSKSGAYSGYVWWHSGPIWASDSIVIRSKDESEYLTSYLYACVKSRQNEIYTRQQGTGQPHIYRNHIEAIPIPAIPIENQRELVRDYLDALAEYEAQKELLDTEHERLLNAVRVT